ncbi:MAG: DNA polymerase III subunit gamma/tau [Candidatus Omnitrophota bacterium]|nr:DNA polymerase III subunit gamma/tau [Candidatus Omnitrophota bacterium]
MSYTVFALKWRPRDFDEVVGQEDIIKALKSALEEDRLGHAYLFAGPRGVGKTSTARILAKALNCKDGPTLKPCQKCASCIEISKGTSFDVIEIDGASNRGIDEIRALRENVKFAPTQGKFKIYIIDEVHQITPDGFNALLKTLEEPPPHVKFIFATTHPHKIMPTILSRCQRLDFRRISLIELIRQLERIAWQEKISVDKDVLLSIARSSDGSLRDAESVLDQLASFSKGKISLSEVISLLGIVEQEALFEITDKIIQKDAAAVLESLNNIIDKGKDTDVFLLNLIEHFRNLMIAKVTKADVKLIDLPEEVCLRLLKQSQAFSMEEIFNTFNILVNTQEASKRLGSLRIPLEISLIRLTHAKKGTALLPETQEYTPLNKELAVKQVIGLTGSEAEKLTNKPELDNEPAKEKVISQGTEDSSFNKTESSSHCSQVHSPGARAADRETTSADSLEPIQPAQTVSLDNIKDNWQDIINNLSKIKISVSTYLNEGQPMKLEKNTLVVAFPKNYSLHKEALEDNNNRLIIEKGIFDLLNARLRVNFILSQEIKQKEDNHNHPAVKSALDMFGGRMVNGD